MLRILKYELEKGVAFEETLTLKDFSTVPLFYPYRRFSLVGFFVTVPLLPSVDCTSICRGVRPSHRRFCLCSKFRCRNLQIRVSFFLISSVVVSSFRFNCPFVLFGVLLVYN